ncbi:MAG: nuclease domain-containing protein, partial [Pseudomonas atacamensis]
MRVSSKKLRASANGQECTVRMPGICNHNPETTVLAHLPCGQKGMGIKGF